MRRSILIAVTVGLACGQDPITLRPARGEDYQRTLVQRAVADFVTEGRTSEAYMKLGRSLYESQTFMDAEVAGEAERRLMAMGLGPMGVLRADIKRGTVKLDAPHVEKLVLQVWPVALRHAVTAGPQQTMDELDAASTQPNPNERAPAYLLRLCGDALRGVCYGVVPEEQVYVVAHHVAQRFAERLRSAVAACAVCGTEPGWRDTVAQWDTLDASLTGLAAIARRRGEPAQWPTSERPWPAPIAQALELELTPYGELHHNSILLSNGALAAYLAEKGEVIVHVPARATVGQLRALWADLKAKGATRRALEVRESHYPWTRGLVWLEFGRPTRVQVRDTDTVLMLVRRLDALTGGLPELVPLK